MSEQGGRRGLGRAGRGLFEELDDLGNAHAELLKKRDGVVPRLLHLDVADLRLRVGRHHAHAVLVVLRDGRRRLLPLAEVGVARVVPDVVVVRLLHAANTAVLRLTRSLHAHVHHDQTQILQLAHVRQEDAVQDRHYT